MCYIFSCFGWALDFIQRAITFILACILCCFVCIGILVAIAAGVAYGYNYSMAEFLTFTRHDTTVYMRRGQFYDKPDFDVDKDVIYARRSGGDGSDSIQNGSLDYQDQDVMRRSDLKSLPESWSQAKDTRKYAERLTKFARRPEMEDEEPLTRVTPAPPTIPPPSMPAVKRVSIDPNPRVVSTTIIESGPSHIVMRNYKPLVNQHPTTGKLPDLVMSNSGDESGSDSDSDHYQHAAAAFYPDEEQRHVTKFFQLQQRPTVPELPPIAVDHKKEKTPSDYGVPMRHWAGTKASSRTEPYLDYKEDVDEDSVVYKPI